MADEEQPPRLPPEQMREVGQVVFELLREDLQALLKNSARSPAPAPPSVELDMLKAEIIREIEDRTRRIVDDALKSIREQIGKFVASDDINLRIATAIEAGFKSIGLLIDKDHLEETGVRMRGVIETQKLIDQTWRTVRMALILAAVGAILSLLGVHLPLGGMEGH